jgi:8-oxo-dGTP pyrophosphatase MutT (NUDIX family)
MPKVDPSQAVPVPAASILLVREAPMEVLMVRRGTGAIFSSKLVFPGGVVDASDGSEEWLPHLSGAESLAVQERSLRIAACRELYEEAGVLVGSHRQPQQPRPDEATYFDLLKAANAKVALDGVVPFGHWITPEGVSKRFDTYFYLCRAPKDAEAKSDGRETVNAEWVSPHEIIQRARDGERSIMFPTLLNLMRLAESPDLDSALAAAAVRPIVAVTPRVERRGEVTFVTIPASAGYSLTEMQLFD